MKRSVTNRRARPFDVPERVREHRRGQVRRAVDVALIAGSVGLGTLIIAWLFAGGNMGIIDWAGFAFVSFLGVFLLLSLWDVFRYPGKTQERAERAALEFEERLRQEGRR
jgi:hypothetical protein